LQAGIEALASQKRERFSVSFARLSTSRQDAAACVSLSFINDVKERRTRGPKSPKQPTSCSGTLEGNRLPRADCIGRRRGVDSAVSTISSVLSLYDLPRRSVKRLVVDFLHTPGMLRKTAELSPPSACMAKPSRRCTSVLGLTSIAARRTHFCRKVTSR
jgi:hypothetical protein